MSAVYPWSQVATDIAGLDDAAIEELVESQAEERKRHGEDAVDQHGRDPVQVAMRTDIAQCVWQGLFEGTLPAYYPDGALMGSDDVRAAVQTAGVRLPGVCVEPATVNALLKAHNHLDVWTPERPTELADTVAPSRSDSRHEPATTTHRINTRRRILDAEIQTAKSRALNNNDPHSVWAELIKMADANEGSLTGQSSDGLQYKGTMYQNTGVFDVFTLRGLQGKMYRDKKR